MKYYVMKQSKKDKTRSKIYPNGIVISDLLPNSYGISQKCGTCIAYDPKTTICSTYNAPVVENYWCATWKGA